MTKVLPKLGLKTDDTYLGNCYSYYRKANEEEGGVKVAELSSRTTEGITKTIEELLKKVTVLPKEGLVGKETILAVLARAASESEFLARLAEDPNEALKVYYTLTQEEKAALASGDIRKIESWVGKLDNRLATWLWCRLGQEKW